MVTEEELLMIESSRDEILEFGLCHAIDPGRQVYVPNSVKSLE
jgi:hypothetical protein